MLCLSGFELYSRWVPLEKLKNGHEIWSIWRVVAACSRVLIVFNSYCCTIFTERLCIGQ